MNISTSVRLQNTRSFNLSDRNNKKIDPKVEACTLEQDDILILTNVQIGDNEQRIKRKFLDKGYELFANSTSNQAAGVAICLRIAKEIKVLSIKKDGNDRVLILKLMIEEEIISVISFYDSNNDTAEHMAWIDEALMEEGINQGIILGGDLNTFTNTNLDQKGFNGKEHYRRKAARLLANWEDNNRLNDIYRRQNPNGRVHT